MRIYLIGMPGVGKSTVGLELSKKLNYDFLDLDLEIAKHSNKSISEIFKEGESSFRDLEAKELALAGLKDNLVISCGGGIVERISNKDLMNGLVILLTLDLDILEERINKDTRPLLKTNSLASLYQRRINKYYYFAKHVINNLKLDSTIQEILRRISYENTSN